MTLQLYLKLMQNHLDKLSVLERGYITVTEIFSISNYQKVLVQKLCFLSFHTVQTFWSANRFLVMEKIFYKPKNKIHLVQVLFSVDWFH